ncbi:MAG TPA: GTP-binding protein [Candidatus Saccharimonadales bacterium]|nr:GTP-binding protein [Candidatus Saccharimonadales bacterium]
MDLLRLSTVGSVDDGKSTLIGRLLFDTKSIFEDQLLAVERASLRRGNRQMNLALLTDGLRAEREQGITIDVAYRYFATLERTFIIADTPGHFEFTRNMVTGASTADVAVVLVDVVRGVVEQSRRHAAIASLLGVPHLVVCVNKMDLVNFAAVPFERVRDDFDSFATGLSVADVTYIPVSALHGDNVVDRSSRITWYAGPSLLERLEAVPVSGRYTFEAGRFPIQLVIAAAADGRQFHGYAGRVEGGIVHTGDTVTSMRSGRSACVAGIRSSGRLVDEAFPPMSLTLELEPELDLVRGDMLVSGEPPLAAHRITASLCWMVEQPLTPGRPFTIKHSTRSVAATCAAIEYRYDVNTHERHTGVASLELNEIGLAEFRTAEPLFVDRYRTNRATGSFIVIDDATHDTAAAGMIETAS